MLFFIASALADTQPSPEITTTSLLGHMRRGTMLGFAVVLAACGQRGRLQGEYRVTEQLSNTCWVDMEVGDVVAVVPSCAAESDDPSVDCNDDTVDMWLRLDSFAPFEGREYYCTLPDAGGGFTCGVADNEHALEGERDLDSGDITLFYAHGDWTTWETDGAYPGLAAIPNPDCERSSVLGWHNALHGAGLVTGSY